MSAFAIPLAFVSVMAVALALTAQLRDPNAHTAAASQAKEYLFVLAPRIPFALIAAECIGRLLPREYVAALLGEQAGLSGTLFASVAGALLPGGPMVAFPLAIALFRAGAGQAPLVALITAWSLLAINRALALELPMLGTRFTVNRLIANAPLPIAAGLLAAAIVAVA